MLTRVLVCLALATAGMAQAAPARRFALVVGSNRGDAQDQPLRYAESDARRVTRVLHELGGFRAGDVVELRTPSRGDLERAMQELSAKAAAEGGAPLLLFYYSGHADTDGLHVAGARLTLDELRGWLRGSKAGVRVAIVDSCRSGALTRVKGMHAAPPVEVRLSDELTARGEALLTSSTSDELARESDALRGSFFTHHLVSGLRGAADRTKDGRVTLGEAYDYAYAHTVTQASGAQHPTYQYDLAGRGDVVLTSLVDAGAWLDFAAGSGGTYLILAEDGSVVGDLEVGHSPIKVAIAPGRYEIRKRTPAGDLALRVMIGRGEERWVHDEEMTPTPTLWSGPAKGDAPFPPPLPDPPEPLAPVAAPKERRIWPLAVGVSVASAVGIALTIAGIVVTFAPAQQTYPALLAPTF